MRFWELFYCYFRYIPSLEREAELFWEGRRSRILPFYLAVQEEDLVLSSLPEVLLKPICDWLGLRYLGFFLQESRESEEGRTFQSSEKLARFRKEFPGEVIERFWTAHYSDRQIVLEAEERRMVWGGELLSWDEFV